MAEMEIRTVLAIGAHPDDAEFQAAGTLARLRQAGLEIVIATMTPGDCGSAELPPEEIAAIRRKEAADAARHLNAPYFCLEERDLAIDYDAETRRKVVALLRDCNPDVVFTHPRRDYMVDHEITSLLVRDACFAAPMPNFSAPGSSPPTRRVPYLYYWDPLEGTDDRGDPVMPEFVVNIAAVIDQKRAMLACHVSQREWLRRQHGIDEYLNSMERWSQTRGADAGFAYGEGFTQHRGHPYPHDNAIIRLLDRD
jgi:LmbE family N-acetylglucosaminyl deacetylase